MWVIFGLCMGMAALVTAKHRSAYQVELTEPIRVGPMQVRMPKDWKVGVMTRTHLALAEANEPYRLSKGRMPRQVKVFAERLDEPMSAQVYLKRSPLVEFVKPAWWLHMILGQSRERVPAGNDIDFESYRMAGTEGVQVGKIDPDGTVWFYACVIVPDPDRPPYHWALTVRLKCDERITARDEAVFRQVAESVSLTKN